MKNCGCVIAERALKEIPDRSVCLNCSTKINNPDTDILILNGTEEEVNAQRELLRSGKKDKTKSRKRKLDKKEKPPKKQRKVGVNSVLIASADIKQHMPKNADPEVYKSIFTSSVKGDINEGETFCCRHASHRLY